MAHADIVKSGKGALRETKSQICNKVSVTYCKSWTYNQAISLITTTETQYQGTQKWKTRKMLPGALALNLAFFMISSMTLNNVTIFLPLALRDLFFGGGGGEGCSFCLFVFASYKMGPRIWLCKLLCKSQIPSIVKHENLQNVPFVSLWKLFV